MECLLACRHTLTVRSVADIVGAYLDCGECGGTQRKLLAVECREWHLHCDDCRYGKWCGQSKDEAEYYARHHNRSHTTHVDYHIVFGRKKLLRQMFGRTVKCTLDSYSVRPFKFMTDTTIEVTKGQQELTDEIPF